MKIMHFGIIGCGAIGSEIAKAIDRGIIPGKLVALYDLEERKARNLVSQLKTRPKIVNLQHLVKMADFIIEAAHLEAVKEIWEEVLRTTAKGKPKSLRQAQTLSLPKGLFLMSIGGLLQNPGILQQARKRKINLYLPSGAISGIDALKAGKIGKIYSVTLVTSKPPAGLEGAPYLVKKKIGLSGLKKRMLIFAGSAEEAIEGFPANINVAGVLSLAGLGAKKTKVKIYADPELKKNVHEIIIQGDFGRITTRTENLPSPVNPKTSRLAILSAIATLKQVSDAVKIGT